MVAVAEHYRWSSVHASLGIAFDPLVTFHPMYLAIGNDPVQRGARYREWLQLAMGEDDLQAVRMHLQQERALGNPRFQAMVAKTLNRPVLVRPRGRPRKEVASNAK